MALALPFIAVVFGVLALLAWWQGTPVEAIETMDMNNPLVAAGMLVFIAVMWPAASLAIRWGGRRSSGFLWSVAGRIRWNIMAASVLPVVAVYTAYFAVTLPFTATGSFEFNANAAVVLVVLIVCVPLQAAAEEVVFRAALPQLVGQWVSSAWLAHGLALPLFVWGHGYGTRGLAYIAVFAVCTAVLTQLTGGIEAATVLHAYTNLLAFAVCAVGLMEFNPDGNISWAILATESAATILTTVAILWNLRCKGLLAHARRSVSSVEGEASSAQEKNPRPNQVAVPAQ